MNITDLPQFKRNAKRFEHIVRILAKYGLADFLDDPDSGFLKRLLGSIGGDEVGELSRLTSAERIRMALAELGTTFIKLGQMLSTRSDLIGAEIAGELEQLQANTPPDAAATVAETIETELGKAPQDLFAEFEEDAMASASIGQVHQAVLKDGTKVVVKVQHAGIEDRVVNDLEILMILADIAERHSSELRLYQPKATVAVFRKNLLRELDFGLEFQNLIQFQRNFEGDETVHIPVAFGDFSARRVLTMEMLEGCPLQDVDLIDLKGLDRKVLARRGVNMFMEMIFRDRFYHADPHPGNLMALENNVIGLLDCGMIGYLDNFTRKCFEGLVEGFVNRDTELLADCCLMLGTAPAGLDRDQLETDIDVFVSEHLSGSLKELDLGRVFSQFNDLVRFHRIVQKPSIQLLIKVMVMLEGTGRLIDPDFNLSEVLDPVYRKVAEERLSPKNFLRRLQRSYRDWDRLLHAAPRDLADIVKRVRQGTLDVHLEHRKLDAVINRITYGMLAAALFLGSSLLWSRQIPPTIFGTSVPGLAGVGVSLWLGFRLVVAIHRSGGLGPGDH